MQIHRGKTSQFGYNGRRNISARSNAQPIRRLTFQLRDCEHAFPNRSLAARREQAPAPGIDNLFQSLCQILSMVEGAMEGYLLIPGKSGQVTHPRFVDGMLCSQDARYESGRTETRCVFKIGADNPEFSIRVDEISCPWPQ